MRFFLFLYSGCLHVTCVVCVRVCVCVKGGADKCLTVLKKLQCFSHYQEEKQLEFLVVMLPIGTISAIMGEKKYAYIAQSLSQNRLAR